MGISYGSNPIIPGEKVLAMFDDHKADAMKESDIDDLIHNALRWKEFRATKRAIRFFERQVVVGFADVAFLTSAFMAITAHTLRSDYVRRAPADDPSSE